MKAQETKVHDDDHEETRREQEALRKRVGRVEAFVRAFEAARPSERRSE